MPQRGRSLRCSGMINDGRIAPRGGDPARPTNPVDEDDVPNYWRSRSAASKWRQGGDGRSRISSRRAPSTRNRRAGRTALPVRGIPGFRAEPCRPSVARNPRLRPRDTAARSARRIGPNRRTVRQIWRCRFGRTPEQSRGPAPAFPHLCCEPGRIGPDIQIGCGSHAGRAVQRPHSVAEAAPSVFIHEGRRLGGGIDHGQRHRLNVRLQPRPERPPSTHSKRWHRWRAAGFTLPSLTSPGSAGDRLRDPVPRPPDKREVAEGC
jgi:hypothetical protein